jgi:hypothetical protein
VVVAGVDTGGVGATEAVTGRVGTAVAHGAVLLETAVVDGIVVQAVVVGRGTVGKGAGAGRVGIEIVLRGRRGRGRGRVGRGAALLLGHVAHDGGGICRRGFRLLLVAVVAGIGSGQTLGVVGYAALHGAAACVQDGDGPVAVLLFDVGVQGVVAVVQLGCAKAR